MQKEAFPMQMTQDQAAIPARNTSAVGSVDSLIDGLRQRLEAEPNDVKGWVLLAKSYEFLQQPVEAQKALAKAKALGYTGEDISVQGSGQSSSPHTTQMTSAADQQMYQYIGGTAGKDTGTSTNTNKATGINVKVSLSEALSQTLQPETTVFIFARPGDQSAGPPLAVVRKQVSDLPLNITLNDSFAMMPGRTISSASNIIVVARISFTGSPTKQPGDIEATSPSIPSNYAKPLELEIQN